MLWDLPLLRAFLVCLALCVPPVAHADVLEIDEDGARVWVSGGREIAAPAPSAPRSTTPAGHPKVLRAIASASLKTDLSPDLIEAVAWTESRLAPEALSPKGARGPMQLMPATARELGVDPRDPEQNVLGGATYLKALLATFDGDLVKSLAAYNAGPSAVRRYGGLPPFRETRAYVSTVLERLSTSPSSRLIETAP